MPRETLTIVDNRTGHSYEIPVDSNVIRATDLGQIRTTADAPGLMTFDPGFKHTAACHSRITFVDGVQGTLLYRGYPIEHLAASSTFLETAYLLLESELPSRSQLDAWIHDVTHHSILHENVKKFMAGFRHDGHPMAILMSTVSALSTFYPAARNIFEVESRRRQAHRLIAKMPTLAAFSYRHSVGLPYAYPDNDLTYAGNFLNMMFKMTELKYRPHPVHERAVDVLFILHADHEQNCSTATMRGVGSSEADPYAAIAAAIAALSGPLHGGANEQVVRMLQRLGDVSRVPEFIAKVKAGEVRLMGFGHRVYKAYDPRATILKRLAEEVFATTGRNPLLDIALELERIALQDDYFVQRKLYPNVDFYSGLIYQALGFPLEMFSVLFAIPRVVGWLAQWEESLQDPERRIARPRQIYTGSPRRDYLPLAERA